MKHFTEVDYHVMGKDERSFQPHNDQAIEILQTWSDDGYFLINDRIFPIQSGAVYLINAIEIHSSNPADIDSYCRNKIIVDRDFFYEIISLCGLRERFEAAVSKNGNCFFTFPPRSNIPYQIDSLFKECAQAFAASNEFSKPTIVSDTIQLLCSLFKNELDIELSGTKTETILNKVMSCINRGLSQPDKLSLDSICQELYISKSYICHLFKQATGLSIMQYVNNLRMSEAKKLLIHTDMKVQDIAQRLGYTSSTFFCKTFRKHIHSSPAKYRADHSHKR